MVQASSLAIRPIVLAERSVYQSAPSGPTAMPKGALGLLPPDPVYSVTRPAVVMRTSLLAESTVNQSAPSGPDAMLCAMLLVVGRGNWWVIVPAVVMRPILPLERRPT